MLRETVIQRYDRKVIQTAVLLAASFDCDIISCDMATREFYLDCPKGNELSFSLEFRKRLSELSKDP